MFVKKAVGQIRNRIIDHRALVFEIRPAPEEVSVLLQMSNACRHIWNLALGERNEIFEAKMRPIYQEIAEAEKQVNKKKVEALRLKLKKAYKDHPLPTMNSQQPKLKDWITEVGGMPYSVAHQTLVELHGTIKSFEQLRKKGDPDAKPPRPKEEEKFFCEISGRSGFQIDLEKATITLSFGKNQPKMTFRIPTYQRNLLQEAQRGKAERVAKTVAEIERKIAQLEATAKSECESEDLENLREQLGWLQGDAVRQIAKDYTITRQPRDMSQPGRFLIALAFDVAKPKTKEFVPEEAVFVALGSTKIGVVFPPQHRERVKLEPTYTPKKKPKRYRQSHKQRKHNRLVRQLQKGEMEIPLGRPDMHWQPEIESIKTRMEKVAKESAEWKRLNETRGRLERLKSKQQKKDRQEVVQRLLQLGTHFVVTDLVIRSKEGRLADGTKPERGGPLGLNWGAQNTGAFAALVAQLVQKSAEKGGTVRKHPMPPSPTSGERMDKIQAAHLLRKDFLSSQLKMAG